MNKKTGNFFGRIMRVILLIALIIVMAGSISVNVVYARTTHTRSEAVEWVKSKIGSGLDYDGVYGAQCVDLIAYYYAYLGTKTPGGNAIDYASNSLPDGWTRVYGDYQPGDIAVFHANMSVSEYGVGTSQYGHVAIITSVDDATYFSAVDQNGPGNKGYCAANRYRLSCIKCAIRPDFDNIVSSSEAAYYASVFVEGLSDTNATIRANLTGIFKITNEGFYISKNADMSSSTKIEEKVSTSAKAIWYDMNKWYGTLDRGTIYYYQLFITYNGVEYKSDTRSFQTTCSHNYDGGVMTTAPTCVMDGAMTYTCTWCGATKAEAIAKTGNHSYNGGEVTSASTCVSDGVKTYTCTVCGATRTESIPKTDNHSYDGGSVTKAATCAEDGVKTYTCTVCGATRTESILKTNNHSYDDGSMTKAPTCAEAGEKTYTCTVCEETKTESILKTDDHSYRTVTQEPTTTEDGWTAKICAVCGKVIDKKVLSKNDNNITSVKFGWATADGKQYWYEDGVKQGTYSDPKGVMGDGTVRGREIYDSSSDGWYWLDAVYNGAKACSKEVWMPYIYQNEDGWAYEEIAMNAANSGDMADQVIKAIQNKSGKWVRYDANGKMYKGWYTVEGDDAQLYPSQAGNTYYYDPKTGLMAKGYVNINGTTYHFDETTGALK